MEELTQNGYAPEEQAAEQPVEQVVEQPVEEAVEQPAEQASGADVLAQAKDAAGSILTNVKKIPKKMLIILGGAFVALAALIILLTSMGNNFKTPLKDLQKYYNTKNAKQAAAYDPKLMNGFCEKEAQQLLKIMKKTDDWDDQVDYMEELIEDRKDEYGKNYKYKFKLEDKEKIDRDDYKDFQESMNEAGEELLDELKDMDSDDIEEMAEALDISKAQARKMVNIMKKIAKKMKNAKVTGGYELEYVRILTGKELDEPEEYEGSMVVYKINGRWISVSALYSILGMIG